MFANTSVFIDDDPAAPLNMQPADHRQAGTEAPAQPADSTGRLPADFIQVEHGLFRAREHVNQEPTQGIAPMQVIEWISKVDILADPFTQSIHATGRQRRKRMGIVIQCPLAEILNQDPLSPSADGPEKMRQTLRQYRRLEHGRQIQAKNPSRSIRSPDRAGSTKRDPVVPSQIRKRDTSWFS